MNLIKLEVVSDNNESFTIFMMNLDQDFVMEATAVGCDTCSVIVIIVDVVVIAVVLLGSDDWVIRDAWEALFRTPQ